MSEPTNSTESSKQIAKIFPELENKIIELRETLLSRHPKMPTLLREIWVTCKTYPEQVTLLKDEDIATIVAGLEQQTNTYLATTSTKAAKSTSKISALKAKGADAF